MLQIGHGSGAACGLLLTARADRFIVDIVIVVEYQCSRSLWTRHDWVLLHPSAVGVPSELGSVSAWNIRSKSLAK